MRLRCAVAALALSLSAAEARVLVSHDEALALAFPAPAAVKRRVVYLTAAQVEDAKRRAGAGASHPGAMVVRYEGWRDGKLVGVGYVETMTVRTLPASVLYVVSCPAPPATPEVTRVEILSWGEPPDYLPRPGWADQLKRPLDPELSLKRGVRPITGATLTAEALTLGARRVLAIHAVVPAPPAP